MRAPRGLLICVLVWPVESKAIRGTVRGNDHAATHLFFQRSRPYPQEVHMPKDRSTSPPNVSDGRHVSSTHGSGEKDIPSRLPPLARWMPHGQDLDCLFGCVFAFDQYEAVLRKESFSRFLEAFARGMGQFRMIRPGWCGRGITHRILHIEYDRPFPVLQT